MMTLSNKEVRICQICDNPTWWDNCNECKEMECTICNEAYGCRE